MKEKIKNIKESALAVLIVYLLIRLFFYVKIYPFNFDNVIETITMKLISKKAYKGYVYYNTLEDKNSEYYSYDEFIKMDKWKIKFSFQIYLERVLKIKHLGFNPTNKTILRCYLKNCLLKPISNNVC